MSFAKIFLVKNQPSLNTNCLVIKQNCQYIFSQIEFTDVFNQDKSGLYHYNILSYGKKPCKNLSLAKKPEIQTKMKSRLFWHKGFFSSWTLHILWKNRYVLKCQVLNPNWQKYVQIPPSWIGRLIFLWSLLFFKAVTILILNLWNYTVVVWIFFFWSGKL